MQLKNHIDLVLSEFTHDSVTVRVSNAVFGAVPFAPRSPSYRTLSECAHVFLPQISPQQEKVVFHYAQSPDVESALSVARAIDTGDTGIAVYSGVHSALQMFFGGGVRAIDNDSEQGVDAALKLLGIAYVIHKLFPGAPQDAASAFYTTPAGQALAFYFASVEVALPFADNLASLGGNAVGTLLQRYGGSAAGKLALLPGGSQIASAAQGMVGSLVAPIGGAVQQVAPYARQIAGSAMQHLPGVMGAADKLAGVVATGADVLPFYRYLGSRLAAEACVLRASRGKP